jgi:hypothetical protein
MRIHAYGHGRRAALFLIAPSVVRQWLKGKADENDTRHGQAIATRRVRVIVCVVGKAVLHVPSVRKASMLSYFAFVRTESWWLSFPVFSLECVARGLCIHFFGRIPHAGEYFDWAGWRFEVVDLDGARVDKLLLRTLSDEQADELTA